MIERLFVYGTLAPSEKNHHFLEHLSGTWESATAPGIVEIQTIGTHIGLPCFKPSKNDTVRGLIFTSRELNSVWQTLDVFEGDEYIRHLITVVTEDNVELPAYVYVDVKSL